MHQHALSSTGFSASGRAIDPGVQIIVLLRSEAFLFITQLLNLATEKVPLMSYVWNTPVVIGPILRSHVRGYKHLCLAIPIHIATTFLPTHCLAMRPTPTLRALQKKDYVSSLEHMYRLLMCPNESHL